MTEEIQKTPPATHEEFLQALEAVLFAAGHPVKIDKLAEAFGSTTKEIRALLKELEAHYREQDTCHGIQLQIFPTTAQLSTKEQYGTYVRDALDIKRGGNLSSASMEVLAIVAYNQPVTRTFIDDVRGMDSSYAVGSLLDKELIEASGRLDAPGRPMLYVTTDKFLRVFGIKSLEELPETEALSVANQAADALNQQTIETDETDEPKEAEEKEGEEE